MTKRDIYNKWRSTKKVKFENNFFFFLLIESQQEGTCPAHFDSISCTYDKNCKSYFEEELWWTFGTRHSLHCSFLKRPSRLFCISSYDQTSCLSSWTLAQHSVTAINYFQNACEKLLERAFSAAGSFLCWLDGQETLLLRASKLGVKKTSGS